MALRIVLLSLVLSGPSSPLCVCCHSIVGLVLCLCDRVVSLWNSGDGLCWAEGRVVSTVYRPLSTLCVLCVVSCCVVLWVVEWRGVWPASFVFLSLFLSSSLLLVFGVVRAQPSEHARYPRTPLRLRPIVPLSLSFCGRLSSPVFHSPPFLLLWNSGA